MTLETDDSQDVIYDKADWHIDGDFPDGLPEYQAGVHIGMYLAWIILHELFSPTLRERCGADIEAVMGREKTGTQALMDDCVGILESAMLSERGCLFTDYYYGHDPEESRYREDYSDTFIDHPTVYHVDDTWANFDQIEDVINDAYAYWSQELAPAAMRVAP